MKNSPNSLFKAATPATCAAIILCALPLAATAADVYWDSNGTTAGAGTTITGNWGTSAFWSNDATGASATTATWNSADTAVFSAGTDAPALSTITLNANTTAAGLKFEEGSVTFVSATSAKSLTLNSNLDLTLGSRTVIFGSSTSAATSVSLLLGTNSLTLNNGNLELNGDNTMASALLKGGVTIIGHANAFGTTGTVTMGDTAANSTVQIRMRSVSLSRPIVLQSGTGFTTNATLNNVGFLSPTVTGGITSAGSGTTNLTIDSIISGAASSLTFTVSGANSINHTGALLLRNSGTGTGGGTPTGTVDVSAAIGSNVTTVTVSDISSGAKGLQRVVLGNAGNAWSGATTINALGRLELSASEVIPHGSGKGSLTVNGTLDLRTGTGDSTETINGLSGNGTITRSGASGTSTLTVGGNDASSTFGGTLQNSAGTLALTKTGSGTLTLNGTTTYSGATAINGGTLRVNTTLANTSGIIIANGAKLEGTGAISSGTLAFSGAGTLSAGNSIGILGLNSADLSNGTLLVEYGTSSIDLVNIAGLLDVADATVNFSQLAGALDGVNPYVFATYGSLSGGTFSNVQNLPNGYAIDYGDGSNSALSLVAVPEPQTALLGAMGVFALLRRRRSKPTLG